MRFISNAHKIPESFAVDKECFLLRKCINMADLFCQIGYDLSL